MLLNVFSEDLHCKLSSLAEDKVITVFKSVLNKFFKFQARLGKTIDTYYNKERNNFENQEQLNIENMLWKSKFMAIAIRADDLNYNLNVALKLFKKGKSFCYKF